MYTNHVWNTSSSKKCLFFSGKRGRPKATADVTSIPYVHFSSVPKKGKLKASVYYETSRVALQLTMGASF